MNAMAFDTHAHVKRLVGAGMSESQAEAIIDALRQTAELPDIGHLATKADLQITKAELQSAIAEVRAELHTTKSDLQSSIGNVQAELVAAKGELRGEIKGLRGELIWWIIGTGVVSWVAHLFFK